MTEKRIRTLDEIEKVWNENGGKNSFPIFRMKVNEDKLLVMNSLILPPAGLFVHRFEEGEQLLICKKMANSEIYAFYALSERFANFGMEEDQPLFYMVDKDELGKRKILYCQRDRGCMDVVEALSMAECGYTGQNYGDGETLMCGDMTSHGNIVKGKSFWYSVSKVGLEELLEYPNIILGHFYFYHENNSLIDLSANSKGGYPTRHSAKFAAVRWAKKNV